MTVAECPPDPADYPDADPSLLIPGSAVFQPTPGPVPLDDPAVWWAYVPGAYWRHPWGPNSDNTERAQHPVTHVAFEDAQAYASWAGWALPCEAEWEYAARGGLDGCIFAWGDAERSNGELMANHWQGEFPWRNTAARGWRGTSPVGLFPPNGYGLYDMTGNVWEWTADYYSAATNGGPASPCCAPPINPRVDTPEHSYDVGQPGAHIRAGSSRAARICAPPRIACYRPAARQAEAIDTSTSHIGFRCVVHESS